MLEAELPDLAVQDSPAQPVGGAASAVHVATLEGGGELGIAEVGRRQPRAHAAGRDPARERGHEARTDAGHGPGARARARGASAGAVPTTPTHSADSSHRFLHQGRCLPTVFARVMGQGQFTGQPRRRLDIE